MTKTNVVALVSAKELAEMLSISQRHLWRMKSAGKLPKPIKFGRCVRWMMSDIESFLAMGCPSVREFEARKSAGRAN